MGENSASTPLSIQDDQLVVVPRDFIFEGMQLPATIFIKAGSNKYVPIGRKGEKANFSDFQAYKNPNLKIFAYQIEYPHLVNYVTELTQKFVKQPTIPAGLKAKFMTSLTEEALRTLSTAGLTSTHQLKRMSGFMIDVCQSGQSFEETLKVLSALPESEAKHSVMTCLVSLLIAEEMQIGHGVALEKLAMGALLHDVGLKFVPKEILEKPRHLWTPDELTEYQQHPIKSVEMLRDLKDISNDILIMIVEHHENAQGTGYPKKLRDVKVSPLGRILALADLFSERILLFERGADPAAADEVIQYIDEILGQPFNKQVFLALKNLANKNHLKNKLGNVG